MTDARDKLAARIEDHKDWEDYVPGPEFSKAERALMVSALRAPALPSWQPITTAPMDGTEIVVLLGRHAVSARWRTSEPGYIGSGWITLESREGFYQYDFPRGWMPLPAPPPEAGGAVETGVENGRRYTCHTYPQGVG